MAEHEGYNGWRNYPTWATYTWLSNDEVDYHTSGAVVAHAGDPVRGGKDLREWVEERSPLVDSAGLYHDVLGWALQIVDWESVARALGPDEWEE